MSEITDEHIEHLKHKDFKNKTHKEGCTCGYCELKKWEKQQQQLRKEFNNRIKSLKLTKEEKQDLFIEFQFCFNSGFLCTYCVKRMELKWGSELSFTIDHIIPRKVGGKDIVENLCFCCRTCNFLKKDMSAEKYTQNMERLIARKNKREYWKARNSSKKDEQKREAFKDIFEMVGVKRKNE